MNTIEIFFFFLQLWTRIIEVGGESGQCVYKEGEGREIAGNIFIDLISS